MKKRILVVDDEMDIVRGLQMALEASGYEVLCAFDGPTAITLAFKHHPDLMILDVVMPKMSGYHVCKELKSSAALSRMPILMLSASGQRVDKFLGYEAGVDEYLTKPINIRILLKKVEGHLRKSPPTADVPSAKKQVSA